MLANFFPRHVRAERGPERYAIVEFDGKVLFEASCIGSLAN